MLRKTDNALCCGVCLSLSRWDIPYIVPDNHGLSAAWRYGARGAVAVLSPPVTGLMAAQFGSG